MYCGIEIAGKKIHSACQILKFALFFIMVRNNSTPVESSIQMQEVEEKPET
jgi:hypothetical protein